MALSSAKSPTRVWGEVSWSEMYRLKSRGAITAPCGTPAFILVGEEKEEPTRTEKNRSSR
jgi:hypothetical protein